MKDRKRLTAPLFALVCSALALYIATTSSPRYATNFWTDTNIYFTIGRGMLQGRMPYRDLFDHKGPLLYVIYALGAWISDTSYAGVFVMEILSLSAVLLIGYKTVRLFGEGALALCVIPITAWATVCCTAFTQGGSAEEFCLPALALSVYVVIRRMREGERCICTASLYTVFGAAMAWVFAIKYTDCGLFFGLAFAVLCWEWRVNGFKRAVVSGMQMLLGLAALLLPLVIWMAAGGFLDECIDVYFIQNMFGGYGETGMSLAGHIYNALAYLRTQSMANPVVAALAVLGCLICASEPMICRRKGFLFEMLALPLGAGMLLLFCYWGEMAHPYYALVFAALVPLGLVPFGWLGAKLTHKGWNAVPIALTAAIVPACLEWCLAAPLAAVKHEEMAQSVFAGIICRDEGAALLDLTRNDQGFYLAANQVPAFRYFADNNLNTQEKQEAIEGYILSGEADYIVTRWRDPGEKYELIAQETSVFDLGEERTYKLYKKKEESRK